MKIIFCTIILLLALNLSTLATIYTYGGSAADILDNNLIGLTESQTLSGITPDSIGTVTLDFTLSGGYGSDLSGYVRLGSSTTSPSYDFSSVVQANPVISAGGQNFSVDVSSAFTSFSPNNTWTLFFADQSPGGTTRLNGWSLDITAVPEPVNVALGIFGGILAIVVVLHSKLVKRLLSKKVTARN